MQQGQKKLSGDRVKVKRRSLSIDSTGVGETELIETHMFNMG